MVDDVLLLRQLELGLDQALQLSDLCGLLVRDPLGDQKVVALIGGHLSCTQLRGEREKVWGHRVGVRAGSEKRVRPVTGN